VPAEMLNDMDVDGVDAQVLYPTLGLLLYGLPSSELVTELFRAYNDWLAEFVSVEPRRLKGIALINVDDVAGGVGEVQRAAKLGLAGAAIAVGPQTPYQAPEYETLWDAAEDVGMPLSLHAGTNRPGTGFDILNLDFASPTMPSLLSNMDHHARLAVGDMIFGGVFKRHPQLRVGIIEQDAGWIPYWLWKMDTAYEEFLADRSLDVGMLPSDYFHRNVFVSFQEDVSAIAQRDAVGVDSLTFGTDYPHYEGTFPQTRARLADLLADCTDEERSKIAGGNVARIYGME
jgi:predicted TIM-barrel fold metal-dependent hydrolase